MGGSGRRRFFHHHMKGWRIIGMVHFLFSTSVPFGSVAFFAEKRPSAFYILFFDASGLRLLLDGAIPKGSLF